MNLREHDDRSDMKVLLSEEETERFLAAAENTEQRIAFSLGVRYRLRSGEWADVTRRDVVDTDAGTMLRVWDGKGDKFQQTPVPPTLTASVSTLAEMRDGGADEPLLTVSSTSSTRHLVTWLDTGRFQNV